MNETATVLHPFFPQLNVNRTYFASAYENLSSTFYIERIGEGKVFCELTNNLFHRLQSIYLQSKLADLCLHERNFYFQTVSKHVNDHILPCK